MGSLLSADYWYYPTRMLIEHTTPVFQHSGIAVSPLWFGAVHHSATYPFSFYRLPQFICSSTLAYLQILFTTDFLYQLIVF